MCVDKLSCFIHLEDIAVRCAHNLLEKKVFARNTKGFVTLLIKRVIDSDG